jgi:hypothetical protein
MREDPAMSVGARTIRTPSGAKIRTARSTTYLVVAESFAAHPEPATLTARVENGTSNLARARALLRRGGGPFLHYRDGRHCLRHILRTRDGSVVLPGDER